MMMMMMMAMKEAKKMIDGQRSWKITKIPSPSNGMYK